MAYPRRRWVLARHRATNFVYIFYEELKGSGQPSTILQAFGPVPERAYLIPGLGMRDHWYRDLPSWLEDPGSDSLIKELGWTTTAAAGGRHGEEAHLWDQLDQYYEPESLTSRLLGGSYVPSDDDSP